MEVAIALGGLLVGWLLGFGQQMWRDRMEARDAIRLIALELDENLLELRKREEWDSWGRSQPPLRDHAWRTHGIVAARILPFDLVDGINMTYWAAGAADQLNELIGALDRRHADAPQEEEELRELLGRLAGVARERAHIATDAVYRSITALAPLAHITGFRLLVPGGLTAAHREGRRAAVAVRQAAAAEVGRGVREDPSTGAG